MLGYERLLAYQTELNHKHKPSDGFGIKKTKTKCTAFSLMVLLKLYSKCT